MNDGDLGAPAQQRPYHPPLPTYIMARVLACWSVPASFKSAAISPNFPAAAAQQSYCC